MSDDGFEEFSDDQSEADGKMDIGEEVCTDFFAEDNRQYKETTVESPFEIPYSNMRDLGKRKPKALIQEETIHLPTRDNDVNIGFPEGSPAASQGQMSEDEDEGKDANDGNQGGISDLLKNLLKRGKDENKSPTKEPVTLAQTKFGIPDIIPPKKSKTVQEEYEEKMAKFAGAGVAMNGIMEEDEFGDDDPLVLLGLAEKKKKKKKEKKDKKEGSAFPSTSHGFSVGIEKPIGLTSAVQAQQIAVQKEKERKEATSQVSGCDSRTLPW